MSSSRIQQIWLLDFQRNTKKFHMCWKDQMKMMMILTNQKKKKKWQRLLINQISLVDEQDTTNRNLVIMKSLLKFTNIKSNFLIWRLKNKENDSKKEKFRIQRLKEHSLIWRILKPINLKNNSWISNLNLEKSLLTTITLQSYYLCLKTNGCLFTSL